MLDFCFATTDEICHELGARLKAQRLAKGWTQLELAGRANVAKGTVQNLENKGVGSLESLVKLASALELTEAFQELFKLKIHSIAQMAAAERVSRVRAPRRRKSV
jgi:transcriptional regulator with XRE-family HTH domain